MHQALCYLQWQVTARSLCVIPPLGLVWVVHRVHPILTQVALGTLRPLGVAWRAPDLITFISFKGFTRRNWLSSAMCMGILGGGEGDDIVE